MIASRHVQSIRRGAVCAALAIGALASLTPATHAQSRLWQPDERVLVTAFHELGAVASDSRHVYAASPNGIEVYDHRFQRWEPPITVEDGYPAGERPTALAVDRFRDALWLGTRNGGLYRHRLGSADWDRVGALPGGVARIVSDPRDSDGTTYVRTQRGWYQIERGSFVPIPVTGRLPAAVARGPVERLVAENPAFRAAAPTLTTDAQLRNWPITDVAAADMPDRYWLATAGGNLYFYDGRLITAEPHFFGLVARGAGSITLDGRALWVGGDGRSRRGGVTRGDPELQRWTAFESVYDDAPAGFVADILPAAGGVWFAASDGVYRLDIRSNRWTRFDERDGLPTARATSLATAPGGVWVGTFQGLIRLRPAGAGGAARTDGAAETVLTGTPIRAMHRAADTLWIASDRGLWHLTAPEAGGGIAPAPGHGAQPALRGRILDVATASGDLFALTSSALYRREGADWKGPIREPVRAGLGRLGTLAGSADALWVGGETGIARLDVENNVWTRYTSPGDIPEGPIHDIVPAGRHVWLATPAGALRLDTRP